MASNSPREGWLPRIAYDVRHALRRLRKETFFTVMVVLTLALGIGSFASVFTILDTVVLRLPEGVRDAAFVKRLGQSYKPEYRGDPGRRDVFSFPEFRAIADSLPSGTLAAAYSSVSQAVRFRTTGTDAIVHLVAGDYFRVLGTRPAAGRLLTTADVDVRSPSAVAVISYQLWKNQFGGSPDLIGQTATINDQLIRIVGVTEPGFRGVGLEAADVWLPLAMTFGQPAAIKPRLEYDRRLQVILRAHDARSLTVARNTAANGLRHLNAADSSAALVVTPIQDLLEIGGDSSTSLAIMAAFSGMVLLLASTNLCSLFLLRIAARRQELALRFALGASLPRILTQLGTEHVLLGILGAMAALALSFDTTALIRGGLLPAVSASETTAAATHLIIPIVALSIVAAVAAGSLAAWTVAARPARTVSRYTSSTLSRVQAWTLALQACFSVMLLIVAGLFGKSAWKVNGIDIGYRRNDVVLVSEESLWLDDSQSPAKVQNAVSAVADEIRALPGVKGLAFSEMEPMRSVSYWKLKMADGSPLPGAKPLIADNSVSPGLLGLLNVRVIRGRDLLPTDVHGAPTVMLVGQSMAKGIWGDRDPIGQCLVPDYPSTVPLPCVRVVGVVEDVHNTRLIENGNYRDYRPLAQSPGRVARTIVIATEPGMAASVLLAVRHLVFSQSFPTLRWQVETIESMLEPQLRPWRARASLFAVGSLLSLILSAIGIYGTTAFAVRQRRKELSIRRALGANALGIIRPVFFRSSVFIGAGMLAGLGISLSWLYALAPLLYSTPVRDLSVLVAACTTVIVAAAFSVISPVRSALTTPSHAVLSAD